MTDAPSTSTPVQADPASPSPVTSLNAKTARRQKLLLGSLGALALVGGSWFILGGDDGAKSDDPTAAQTIDTAGLINRDLSQREFVATYGNRLDAVTREQKAMKDASLPREEIEAQLAALKAENQAMRVDGQAAIDAISAENADLKTRLASQPHPAPPSVPPPAYGPQAGGYDARGRTAPSAARRRAGGGR
jgi:conjugal transfer pilus assembly protein TraB